MTNKPIENAYGTLYLTQKRADEYIEIVSKHTMNMLLELKEHKLIPSFISLEKTVVRELDYYNNKQN